MSSLFFTCKNRSFLLPDEDMKEEAQALLQNAKTFSSSNMVRFYSNDERCVTAAAVEWAVYSQFGLGEVYFWRGAGISSKLYEALVEDQLDNYCMIRAARLPFVHEYIKTPCLAFASGSHLYGLATEESDWDGVVLVNDLKPLKTDDTEPFFRIYTPSLLFQDARRGLRHAWELLTAPSYLQMAWDISLEETRQQALRALSKTAIPWRDGSREYFMTWYPRFFIQPSYEADPSIKRWKMKKGWPYKLGYYLFIDAYLSFMAQASGIYQTTIADPEITSVLCRMKQGEMILQEWLDLIAPLLPPGCDLADSEGRLPVEFASYEKVSANDSGNSQILR
jgi:hypothetical protein